MELKHDITDKDVRAITAYNRTKVELKLTAALSASLGLIAYNRTKVELKLRLMRPRKWCRWTYNRTKVELKQEE